VVIAVEAKIFRREYPEDGCCCSNPRMAYPSFEVTVVLIVLIVLIVLLRFVLSSV